MKIFILIQKICRDRLLSGSVSECGKKCITILHVERKPSKLGSTVYSIFSLIFFVSARVIILPILALGMLTKHCLFFCRYLPGRLVLFIVSLFPNFTFYLRGREQGWRSGESFCHPPLQPGFDSRTWCHLQVCCWFSSQHRRFFSGFLPTFQISVRPGQEEPLPRDLVEYSLLDSHYYYYYYYCYY